MVCVGTEAGTLEGIRHNAPRESALIKLLTAWTARVGEGTKHRPNRVCTFVKYPKTGTACNSGPAPYSAAWSLSSVDGESTHATSGGKPSVAGTLRVLPTQASDIVCSAPPSPQHDWTSEHKQETTSAHLCQGGNYTLKRPCRQKPNKQRKLLQKWQVQEIKILVVNTDYTWRDLYMSRSVSWNKELPETEPDPHWLQQLQRNS